jgi:topoisomerase IA-like protein
MDSRFITLTEASDIIKQKTNDDSWNKYEVQYELMINQETNTECCLIYDGGSYEYFTEIPNINFSLRYDIEDFAFDEKIINELIDKVVKEHKVKKRIFKKVFSA